jgi:glyoxylase-like metal-dependent hydrolase (beta-lactamase superfamily II)
MKIIPLSEGAFTIDKSKLFVPFALGADDLQQRPVGSLLVEVQPFVVVTSEDILLLDTGLGFSTEGSLQIYQNLRKNGIEPDAVTKVLMSHLHKDHAGGVSKGRGPEGSVPAANAGMAGGHPAGSAGGWKGADGGSDGGAPELAFPNAKYYIQRKELEYAFEKGPPSYLTGELEALRGAPQVILLDGDGVVGGYIKYELTGAHCPYHQVFRIVDAGTTIFFGGDVAPQLQQMKSRFVAKYDYDGKRCMELRQQWWEKGKAEGWTFLFYHDIQTPIYSF